MEIIVPDAGPFAAFEAALDWPFLQGILASLQPVDMQLTMPKFTFSRDFELAQACRHGHARRFLPRRRGLLGHDWLAVLYIDSVVHQAFVAVDEGHRSRCRDGGDHGGMSMSRRSSS